MKYHQNSKFVHQQFRNIPYGAAAWAHTNLAVAPVVKCGRKLTKLGNGTTTSVANVSTLYVRVSPGQLRFDKQT